MVLILYYYFGVLHGLLITLFLHFIIYILKQNDRKKEQENLMIQNAVLILEKLDKIKSYGGYKMNEDIKKLAKYLAGKIDEAKEDILAEIESRFEELAETSIEEAKEEIMDTDFKDEFEVEPEEQEEPEDKERAQKVKDIFDVSKRQIKTVPEEEPKKKKRGLFGGKK